MPTRIEVFSKSKDKTTDNSISDGVSRLEVHKSRDKQSLLSPNKKVNQSFNSTMQKFKKKLRQSRNQKSPVAYLRKMNTVEDLMLSKNWKLRYVKKQPKRRHSLRGKITQKLTPKNTKKHKASKTPRQVIELSKEELMEMYEKVKKERDEYKQNFDLSLLDEGRSPKLNNYPEEPKSAKKSKGKCQSSQNLSKTKGKIEGKLNLQKLNKELQKSKELLKLKKSNKTEQDAKIKNEFIKLMEDLKHMEAEEQNRFKLILDKINEQKAEIELSLSRILAWNYFAEIQRIKEKHKSEVFILHKQIEGLKGKLIEINSKAFKEREGVSLSGDESGEFSTQEILRKPTVLISPPPRLNRNASLNKNKSNVPKQNKVNQISVNITKIQRKSVDIRKNTKS